MKALLTICCFLLFASNVTAQRTRKHPVSLTRSQIKEAERRLADLGYWTGAVDGIVDTATRSALIAFQKWEGRDVTGRLTIDEFEAIQDSKGPRARDRGYAHVEVDLDRQILMLVNDESDVRVLPVSTGNGASFKEEGKRTAAYTPRGRFLVYHKGYGWEKGPLGSVYYANDISGGIAIHGARSVPSKPASHGCIRIPMFAAREVSRLLEVGTIVLVYDKDSFVSAKAWVKNPELKQAVLESRATTDYDPSEKIGGTSKSTKNKSSKNKKARSKSTERASVN